MNFNNLADAKKAWGEHRGQLAKRGIVMPSVVSYIPEPWKENFGLAMDAQPGLTTDPNSGIPTMLSTMVDPQVFRVLFAPNQAAVIFGEQKKGDWLMKTTMFPIVEHEGEVSSYGDFSESGHAGANSNWPQRQSYLFQIVKEYGEYELEAAGLGKINWVTEVDVAAATMLNKYQNLTYFYGVQGLENYGLLNDPGLSASITPATKVNGGATWFVPGTGQPNATANEVYNDVIALFQKVVNQNSGLVDKKARMKLCMSPDSSVALTFTNSFNVNVEDLLKKNFPNMTVETAMQYGVLDASNPQGIAAGNLVQLIVSEVDGQQAGYCAFNEKLRAHPIIRALSSFKQKETAGSWGAVVRQPSCISSMLGV